MLRKMNFLSFKHGLPVLSRAHIFVSGRVQGVFFRENTLKKAQKIGVFGWVKNLPDNRLEAVFEGEEKKLKKIIKWMKKGSLFAKVDNIDIQWQTYKKEFKNFEIKYDDL